MMIRTAAMPDLDALVGLEAASFPPGDLWSVASWADELAGSSRRVFVAEAAAAVLGVASFEVVADAADLRRIMVSPAARGNRHAGALISAGVAWATDCGASRVLLEVGAGNLAARSCYERAGFRAISERRNYYADGGDAVIMALDLEV